MNRIFGSTPKFTARDCESFSHGDYRCKFLFTDRRGAPVAVLRRDSPDFPVWAVEYRYSRLTFNTLNEALGFCRKRFSSIDGRKAV